MGGISRPRGWRAFRSLRGNKALVRVVGGYVLFTVTEYSVWVAMLVYAYRHGGAAVAGLVAVAQLVPAAVLAPIAVAVADRRSPVFLLAGGYLVQAAGMAATAVAVLAGVPLAAYAAAVVASAAVTATRPAQSTLIPSVSVTPDQLTAANVVVSWVEAAGIAAAGLLAGVLISVAGVASVFAVCAGLGLAAALLVAGLRVPPLASSPGRAPAVLAGLGASIRLTARQPRLRLMLALLTAEAAVVGALDLLFVILAISVLHRTQAWAGYLNSAYGVGAVLAAVARITNSRSSAPTTTASAVSSASISRSRGWRAISPRLLPSPASTAGARSGEDASGGTRSRATSNAAARPSPNARAASTPLSSSVAPRIGSPKRRPTSIALTTAASTAPSP